MRGPSHSRNCQLAAAPSPQPNETIACWGALWVDCVINMYISFFLCVCHFCVLRIFILLLEYNFAYSKVFSASWLLGNNSDLMNKGTYIYRCLVATDPCMVQCIILFHMWCDMVYLLTEIELTPGGSSIVHIYTQTIHRTTQGLPTWGTVMVSITKCISHLCSCDFAPKLSAIKHLFNPLALEMDI